MKKVKVITSNAELEEFLARTDIEVINVDVRSCEQSWFAQEYFTAVIYYDDEPKSEYNPGYWTRLEHQAAIAAMQGMLNNSYLAGEFRRDPNNGIEDMSKIITKAAAVYAHALVEKMKEKEE